MWSKIAFGYLAVTEHTHSSRLILSFWFLSSSLPYDYKLYLPCLWVVYFGGSNLIVFHLSPSKFVVLDLGCVSLRDLLRSHSIIWDAHWMSVSGHPQTWPVLLKLLMNMRSGARPDLTPEAAHPLWMLLFCQWHFFLVLSTLYSS